MTDRIERELLLPASPEEVWDVVTGPGWLADEVRLDLFPGGDARFRSRDVDQDGLGRGGCPPTRAATAGRLAFWWASDGDPATRVELTLDPEGESATRLRVVETRPLEVLDLIGTPLPGAGGRSLRPGAGGRVSDATTPQDPAGVVFGALSDPTRRALLAAVARRPEATATELAAQLPISRQAVLKHLTALAQAGLLHRERSGRDVRYRVTPAPLSEAVSWMAEVGGQWDARLAKLSSQFRAPPAAPSRRRPVKD